MKVMIIDDNPISSFIIEEGIPKSNDIFILNDSKNILNSVKVFKPDVVLLDIVMPNVSGFDILKKIKAFNEKIKVIIISALTNQEAINKSYRLGADYFVKKPFKLDFFKNFMEKNLQYIN